MADAKELLNLITADNRYSELEKRPLALFVKTTAGPRAGGVLTGSAGKLGSDEKIARSAVSQNKVTPRKADNLEQTDIKKESSNSGCCVSSFFAQNQKQIIWTALIASLLGLAVWGTYRHWLFVGSTDLSYPFGPDPDIWGRAVMLAISEAPMTVPPAYPNLVSIFADANSRLRLHSGQRYRIGPPFSSAD